MQGYQSFLPAPIAAPGVTAGSTFTVRTRRRNASGTVTAASPTATIDFPGTITPEALDAGFPAGELVEDEILISADGGTTFYKIVRAASLTGAYTIASYTAGSGTLVSGAEITSGTQTPDYSGVDYAVRIGSPQTKRLFLLNEGGLTLTDLLMSVVNPENDEAQTELSGHFQIDYLGNFNPDGIGTLSGTPASVLWDATAGIRSEIPLTLDNGHVAVFDITISIPAGGSSEGAIPWRLDIQDTSNVISIATVPGWARGTFLISREFGTSLPILSVVSGSVNINRCYVNIGRNLAAVNRSALPATLATATGYKFYVSGNGIYSFTTGDVPSGAFHLATFDWNDGTDTISNLVYETGIATASYLEIPTDQTLLIGQAVKVEDNSGSLNCLATTGNAERMIGFVSKKPAGGYVGVSTGGQAFAIASAAISIAAAVNSAAAGKVRTVSADEREDAVAFEAAGADGDYLLVKVQPIGSVGAGGGGGSPAALVINNQSAAFTVDDSYADESVNLDASSAAFTVTLNALSANGFVDFAKRDSSANAVTLAAGAGVTVQTSAAGLGIAAQYNRVSCRFDLDNDEWICSGDLS